MCDKRGQWLQGKEGTMGTRHGLTVLFLLSHQILAVRRQPPPVSETPKREELLGFTCCLLPDATPATMWLLGSGGPSDPQGSD